MVIKSTDAFTSVLILLIYRQIGHRPRWFQGNGGLMDMVSALQLRDHGFKPHTGHDHDSSYDTSTGLIQEADFRVI